jgi:hypothetical protein
MVIDYQLQLRTELSTQLQTELSAETDTFVREALQEWLAPVFTDKAKDIDLHFFKSETDVISRRIQDVINANRTSYTIKLPLDNYMHLALANMADNNQMTLGDYEHSKSMVLNLPNSLKLKSMNTGVFSARLPMQVEDKSQNFEVFLYMVTAAVALVIDTTACDSLVSMEGTLNDAACGFSVRDSIFDFSRTCHFEMVNVHVGGPAGAPRRVFAEDEYVNPACLATVGMPTQDSTAWTLTVVSELIGNRKTTSTLTINDALEAGTVRIIRLKMKGDGSVIDDDENNEVGITVTLEWKDGGDHEMEL